MRERKSATLIDLATINTLDIQPSEEFKRRMREDPKGFMEEMQRSTDELIIEARRATARLEIIPLEKRSLVLRASAPA